MMYAKVENILSLVLIELARLSSSAQFGDHEKRKEAPFPVEATAEATAEATVEV